MKVFMISKALVRGAYHAKLEALAARGVETTLVLPTRWGVERPERVRASAYRIVPLPAVLHGHNHLHLYRGLARTLEHARPDLVHIDEEAYSLVSLQALGLARRRGVPAVFFAWQNIARRYPPPFRWSEARVLRGVAGALAGSQEALSVLRAKGFAGPADVVPQFGVDPGRFRPERRGALRRRLGVADDAPLVGYAGRLVPEKGLRETVEALGRLRGADAAHLVLLGEGPERSALESLARRLGLAARVHLPGALPSERMAEHLPDLDVLVLFSRTGPTWKEQFGRVLVEAMSCGVPVVGSDSGAIPDVIGDAGVVVKEGRAEDLAITLAGLLEHPDERRRLAALGRGRVLDAYTQEHVAQRTLAFYRRVLARGAASC